MNTWVTFLGLSLEIFGALLLASSYLSATSLWQIPRLLLRALFYVNEARFSASLSKQLNAENQGYAVRGIAFLVIGFLLQAVGVFLNCS